MKRARSQSPHPAPAQEAVRSKPWFDDGNIVICAHPKLFRVYRGLLAYNSPVFEDMFSIGTSQGDETIDGCPVVQLFDEADHVELVLNALFHGTHLTSAPEEKVPFSVVAAFMHLGRKYDIERLYKRGTALLVAQLPSSHQGWQEKRENEYAGPIELYRGVHMDFVTLAREHNLSYLLPAAHLLCVSLPLPELFDGTERPDGSRSSLSPRDLKAQIIGRDTLCALSLGRSL